jgi:hypothetical protein
LINLKYLIIYSLIAPTITYSCIGRSIKVAMVGIGDTAVIQRTIIGEAKEELLDDTGYIGAHVLIADLLNSSEESTIDSVVQKPKINALKERLSLLLKRFGAVLANKEYKASAPAIYKNIEDAASDIKKLKEIIDSNPTRAEVDKIWHAIESKVNSAESSDTNIITAKYRKPGSKQWSENEDMLTVFSLPIVNSAPALTRSAGCENEMLDVNLIYNIQRSGSVVDSESTKKSSPNKSQNSMGTN